MKVSHILVLFLFSISANAQERMPGQIIPLKHSDLYRHNNLLDQDKKLCICCKHIGDTSNTPLYVIKGIGLFKTTEVGNISLINPYNFESVEVHNNDRISKSFGSAAKYGVIIITYKKNVSLYSFKEALDKFNIDATDRNLKVCISQHLFEHPDKLIFDNTSKYKMEIVTDKYWIYMNEVQAPEPYINITTL